jgi:hypothetical protein
VVLEGFASRPSYLPGETLRVAVSTSAASFEASIWRVSGREPDGQPFRQMATLPPVVGQRQPPAAIDPATRMASASWTDDVEFAIPVAWPSGVYLVRLASTEHVQAYVPFVVRSGAAHAVLVVSNAMTWQAYNAWGGSSLYVTHVGMPAAGIPRALAVSFDRPYTTSDGAGQLFTLELPLLRWIDARHLDVAYTTDYDLSIAPDQQPTPRVIVVNAHSEYWGTPLYDWLDRHVTQAGDVSLAMLAADSGYWPVSFGATSAEGWAARSPARAAPRVRVRDRTRARSSRPARLRPRRRLPRRRRQPMTSPRPP